MKCPYCIKICTKCNRLLVANSMNFAKQKNGKYGVISKCKECTKKYYKQYYEANPEYIKEYHKQYYENNSEYIKERNKQWREANPEYNKERNKQYYENNSEYIKERNKQWREANPEYNKQWREANPEYNKQYYENNRERKNEIARKANHKRRAKLKSNGGEYTLEQWNECLEFFDYTCAYSGAELNKDNTNIEHIIPISKGGTNDITNIVPALDSVNKSKNASDMLEWYKQQPYYSEERLNKILDWLEYATKKYEL